MFDKFLAEFEAGVSNVSGFIGAGEWNGQSLLPLGPIIVLLLGTGIFVMCRIGFRPAGRQ